MAKYFLGSVGAAEAFRLNSDGTKTFMFRATSLTDSGINISSSQDELRGGTGAPIVATFNHDATVELNLTDVFWKPEYVEAQLGVKFQAGASDYQSEEHIAASNNLVLDKIPLTNLYLPCSGDQTSLIMYTVKGEDEWKFFEGTVSEKTLQSGFENGKSYCVRYLANDEQARETWVTSDIIPDELYLIITTPIYAGDACAASNGQVAGHLTFEVPRFKLNAAQDFAFSMSSNTTMSLAGRALAYIDGCNLNGSRLLRIVENLEGRKWYNGLKAIYIDPEQYGAKAGEVINVYGVYENDSVVLLDNGAKIGENYALTFAFSSHAVTVTLNSSILGYANTDTITVDNAVASVGEHTGLLA